MAKRKTTTTFNAIPVVVVERSGKLAVQIPSSLSDGWEPQTPIQIKKSGEKLTIKRGAGDDTIKGTKFSFIEIELTLADKLGWDKGLALLLQLDGDIITLKEPEGLDFCLDNLFESFLFVRLTKGEGSVEAIANLGNQVGKVFRPTQLARWRAGGSPPNEAINIMTGEVMQAATAWGLDAKDLPTLQRGIRLLSSETLE